MSESAAWRVTSRTVLLIVAVASLVWLGAQLQKVLVQLTMAIILAAGMAPIVSGIERLAERRQWRFKPPRALVVLVLYLIGFVIFVAAGAAIARTVALEVSDLIRRLPGYFDRLVAWFNGLVLTFPMIQTALGSIDLSGQIEAIAGQLAGVLTQALVVAQYAVGLLGGALDVFLTLILALYLTADAYRVRRYVIGFLPRDREEQAWRASSHIGERLGGWVRGMLLLCAVIGVLTYLGLTAIGVPYAMLLALIAAVGEAVPMVGPIFATIPAVIVATAYNPTMGLATLLLYLVIQQLENNLLVPRIMSRAVELHPLAVMVALLAGSELMGVAGAVLAVPVTAALSVVVDEIRRERLGTEPEHDGGEA
jgi:predicted PurR-regulated permease PerM